MRAFFVRLMFTVMSWLPLPLVHWLGEVLGRGLLFFSNDMRDIAWINIQRCFPSWTKTQQQALLSQSLQETAKAILELGTLWLRPIPRVLPLVRKVSGEEVLQQAIAKGKGVILVSPHLGAWEIVGLYASNHWPMTSLYRPPRQPSVNGIMRQGRERAGAKIVPIGAAGIRALYKALGQGELVAILPDQDPGKMGGVFAPFFGIQANTMTLLSRLAGKTGATVLMTYAERLPKGRGYHLHFHATDAQLIEGDEIQKATVLNQAVEQCVLQQPSQYLWAYKRFKTRPENEDRFY